MSEDEAGADARGRWPDGVPPVWGFHGAGLDQARELEAGIDPDRLSTNDYDWLGKGLYFWQDSPGQAVAWAQRHGDPSKRRSSADESALAVFAARIELSACVDLLDPAIKRFVGDEAVPLMDNLLLQRGHTRRPNEALLHFADREVFDFIYDEAESGVLADAPKPRSVRAAYGDSGVIQDRVQELVEDPIFDGSNILNGSHVQIALRDPDAVIDRFVEELMPEADPPYDREPS